MERYRRGRPHPDHINDIMHRVVKKYLDEKRMHPRSIIPLFQERLAKEIGTTRISLDKGFKQYVGQDLKALDPSFEGLKIYATPSAYVLDDVLGELLLVPYAIGGKGIYMGLCTSCGEWTQMPTQMPRKITCDGCGLVYAWEYDRNLNLKGEYNLSPLWPFLLGVTIIAACAVGARALNKNCQLF